MSTDRVGSRDGSRLVALPPQAERVPWPTAEWPTAPAPPGVDLSSLLEEAFDDEGPMARSFAVVVVHRGQLVAERYGGVLEHFDRPPDPVGPDSRLLSWSMAKSMLHAAIGLLVADGLVSLGEPAPVDGWAAPRDPRRAITLEHLLEMRDGLEFREDYVDAGASDVIEMLFGSGKDDVAAFAAARPPRVPPGERFSYSSGTSNIVAGILKERVGRGPLLEEWLRERLFDPIGATAVELGFDASGTWVASSFVHATARDYARFGELYLRGGWWEGRRILPEGWVDHGRTPRSLDEDGSAYGAHWWVLDDPWGSFRAAGYEGQSIVVSPGLDLVLVRLGKTPEERSDALAAWTARVLSAFAGPNGP